MKFNTEGYLKRKTKKAKTEYIKQALISGDRRWLGKALIAINGNQKEEERRGQISVYKNGIGFNAWDANLSVLAEQLTRTGNLSKWQWQEVHRKMPKYAGQLVKLADAKQKKVDYKALKPKIAKMILRAER